MPFDILFTEPWGDWGWKVGVYVALLGLAGGAYIAAFGADLLAWRKDNPRLGSIAKYGYLSGLLALIVGPPVLLSHLATPFRAALIPLTMTNFGSWMTIGAYMIGGAAVGTIVMFGWTAFGTERPYRDPELKGRPIAADGGDAATDGGREIADGGSPEAAAIDEPAGGLRVVAGKVGVLGLLDRLADVTRPSEPIRMALGGVFAIFAAGVLVYSAMAFGSGPEGRVALWNETFLLPVQILSGLGIGLGTAVGLTALLDGDTGRALQNYALATVGLMLATLLAVIATVTLLPSVEPAAEAGVANMLGEYALLFVGGAIVVGILVPVVLLLAAVFGERRGALSPTAARASYFIAAFILVPGQIMLAWVYLLAAEYTPLILPV